jgi:hypothetical protein
MTQRLTLNDIFVEEYDKANNGKAHKIVTTGNTVHFTSEDPYGFWRMTLDKGGLPAKYQGSYTTLAQAIQAAQAWITEKKLEVILPTKEEQDGPNSKANYKNI